MAMSTCSSSRVHGSSHCFAGLIIGASVAHAIVNMGDCSAFSYRGAGNAVAEIFATARHGVGAYASSRHRTWPATRTLRTSCHPAARHIPTPEPRAAAVMRPEATVARRRRHAVVACSSCNRCAASRAPRTGVVIAVQGGSPDRRQACQAGRVPFRVLVQLLLTSGPPTPSMMY